MKKTAYCFLAVVLAIAVVTFSGCATAPAVAGPALTSNSAPPVQNYNPAQYQSAPAVAQTAPMVTGGYIAKDQPPIGTRTVRWYIRPDGSLTDQDGEAVRVMGVKVGFWGAPGAMLSPTKPAALQKWSCGGLNVYNALFDCEARARAFLSDPNKKIFASNWRATLDSTPAVPDPSRPGATQVYMDLPY